jgi:hypothetical protein
MDTPFRNDVDALKTRLASLEEELVTLRAQTREYEAARERLARIESEHADLQRELDARSRRRAAPFLDTLRIASPCHERWDDMIGDHRTRFCGKCQKNVHNVSEMTRDEAEAFLASVASSACVRMYQRTDGTVLTADCPVGMRKKRVKRLFLATFGGGLAAAAGVVAFWRFEEATVMGAIAPSPLTGQVVMGEAEEISPPPAETTSPRFATPPEPAQPATDTKPPLPEKSMKTPPQPRRDIRPSQPPERIGF